MGVHQIETRHYKIVKQYTKDKHVARRIILSPE